MATVIGVAAVVTAAAAPGRAAVETAPCDPACGAGETCVEGVCMVPARPAPATASPPATPPPGYPPPPYGYPPPPYGYPPSPYGYPPPVAAPPPAPRAPRTGFLAIPYVGFNSPSGNGTSTGLRIGAILGGRVNDVFSANGELTGDVINLDTPVGYSASEYLGMATLSPLFHVTTPSVDLVAGPKLGLWYLTAHAAYGYDSVDVSVRGWTLGFNLGLFFPVSDTTSLGMLLSYATLQPTHRCVTQSGYGESCGDAGLSDDQILGLTFAALF